MGNALKKMFDKVFGNKEMRVRARCSLILRSPGAVGCAHERRIATGCHAWP
jgi:hypothetical protein